MSHATAAPTLPQSGSVVCTKRKPDTNGQDVTMKPVDVRRMGTGRRIRMAIVRSWGRFGVTRNRFPPLVSESGGVGGFNTAMLN